MKHKKQHYIPESYLKAWCDPGTPAGFEPYVWIVSKDGTDIRNRAPTNMFHETDLYTIQVNGERDLSIETSLSTLEGLFCELRRSKLASHNPLTPKDKLILCAFAAAMYSRTPASADRWTPFWAEVADKARRMTEWAEKATREQRAAIAPAFLPDLDSSHIMTLNEIEELAKNPVKSLVTTSLEVLTPLLFQIDLVVVETATKPGFITSDDPCVWFDPGLKPGSWPPGPALVSPSIEIHLPISPSQCLLFNRRGHNGYLFVHEFGPLVDLSIVAEANWRTCRRAKTSVVVNQKIILLNWFVHLQPP